MNPKIGEHAAAGGHAKAARAQAVQRAQLDAALPADGLPPLDSIENAQRRLEILNRLLTEGYLSGGQGGAAVRAIEVWLKGEAARLDRQRLVELEAQVRTLRAELRNAQRGRAPVTVET